MKVGIDIRSLAAGKHTGVEEYVRGLLAELFRRCPEHQFVLFFNAWGGRDPDLTFAEGFPHVEIRRFRIPNKLLNFALWYLRVPKLDRLIGGADIFWMPNMNFGAVSRSCRLVVTAHDLSFEWFPETFSWRQRLWHSLVNLRGLIRRADRAIAISHSTADDLRSRYQMTEEKVSVIPSGVGSEFKPLDRNSLSLIEVQKRYRLPYRFILSLGTLEPRKNLISLLRAFEAFHLAAVGELAKYELVIAGAPGWKCEEFLSTLRRSPVRHHVHLLGFVEPADKPALYNLASVFVYPSFYEGFGFPPLEALASGTPVIASHSASLPEVVGEAGILVDPYRPDEIREAFIQLLSDKAFADRLRERALIQAGRFSWGLSAQAVKELFTSLADPKR